MVYQPTHCGILHSRVSSTATTSDRTSVQTSSKVLVLSAGDQRLLSPPPLRYWFQRNRHIGHKFQHQANGTFGVECAGDLITYVVAPTKHGGISGHRHIGRNYTFVGVHLRR